MDFRGSLNPLIKLVIVGDGCVGKTCILVSYTTDRFPTEYVPTVFDNYTTQVEIDGTNYDLLLQDTAGQEAYNQLRHHAYHHADIYLITFSVVDIQTFENALQKWYPELNSEAFKQTPKIFLGNKIDLRDENNMQHIKSDSAKQIINDLSSSYFECSALTQVGMKDVFDASIKQVLQNRRFSINKNTKIKKEDEAQRNSEACLCKIF